MRKGIFTLIVIASATVTVNQFWPNVFTLVAMILSLIAAIIVAGIDMIKERR